jgi:outer membrane protein TolC
LRAALNARQSQIKALQTQYESFEKLLDSGFSSLNLLSQVQTQLSLAQSEAYQLQSNIDQNQSRLRELQENIKAIQHDKGYLTPTPDFNSFIHKVKFTWNIKTFELLQ